MKYIDADKLISEIERQQRRLTILSSTEQVDMRRDCALQNGVYNSILDIITSLQQEQPESSKSKFVFPNFLYVRTKDNKTIDVSYAPQSIDAVEYIKNDYTEQPEVDIIKEVQDLELKHQIYGSIYDFARHFFKLGLNARKEE